MSQLLIQIEPTEIESNACKRAELEPSVRKACLVFPRDVLLIIISVRQFGGIHLVMKERFARMTTSVSLHYAMVQFVEKSAFEMRIVEGETLFAALSSEPLSFLELSWPLESAFREILISYRWGHLVLRGRLVKVVLVGKHTSMDPIFVLSFAEAVMIAEQLSAVLLAFMTIVHSLDLGCGVALMLRVLRLLKLENIVDFQGIVFPIFAMGPITTMMGVHTFCRLIAQGIVTKIQTARCSFQELVSTTLISK